MLQLSKKVLFALEAVVDIAYNARPEPVQSKDITKRQGIPQRYLEQVMQQLVHAGILKGVRGPRGGYTLARERRRITVGEIVRTVGAHDTSEEDKLAESSPLGMNVVRPVWREMQDEFMTRLDTITLDDLCNRARTAGVETAVKATSDFII